MTHTVRLTWNVALSALLLTSVVTCYGRRLSQPVSWPTEHRIPPGR